MHYTGMLEDGVQFDTTHEDGRPLIFRLGDDEVLAGLELGVHLCTQGRKDCDLDRGCRG